MVQWIRDNALKIIGMLCAAIVAIGGYAVSLSVDVKVNSAKMELMEKQHADDVEMIWAYMNKVEQQREPE